MLKKIKEVIPLLTITFICFAPVLIKQFIDWDFGMYLKNNPFIQEISWSNIKHLLGIHIYWMPLTWFSYMIEFKFANLTPTLYHSSNLALHLFNTLIVYLITQTLLKKTGRFHSKTRWIASLIATLFWALHPMRVEAVAWVINRKGLLCSFFMLLSLYTSLSMSTKKRWIGMTFFGFCAFASHPNAILLPLLLIVIDFFPLKRFSLKSLKNLFSDNFKHCLIEKIPLFLLSFFIGFATINGQQNISALDSNLPFSIKFSNSIFQIFFYLKESISHQSYLPIYEPKFTILNIWLLSTLSLILIIFTIICVISRQSKPYLLASFSFYIICLTPTLGIMQAGWVTHADRWVYIAMLPLNLFLALIIATSIEKKFFTKSLLLLTFGFLISNSLDTQKELRIWKNNVSFFSYLSNNNPNNIPQFNIFIGKFFLITQNYEKAKSHFIKVLEHKLGWHEQALFFLSFVEEKQNNISKAIEMKQRGLLVAEERQKYDPNTYLSLTYLYLQENNIEWAQRNQKALKENVLDRFTSNTARFNYSQIKENYQLLNAIIHLNLNQSEKAKACLEKQENPVANFWKILIKQKTSTKASSELTSLLKAPLPLLHRYLNEIKLLHKKPRILINFEKELKEILKDKASQ